ncbi:acetamidase/formamidase family protein [Cellulomonas sp. DKR-3]|uniref:Acetamidase/formamidase family protein n=1 Tax=Cellulomonas fulva TaxID=2835530 RepID=A0ABS5TX79_9CELL|nr:acetamidase/formamidase family protein [Cellulomonas fulva]
MAADPFVVLQPGLGPIRATTYLPATPETVRWGRLPCGSDEAVLEVAPGTEVTIDTVSHEGLLPDQGDPVAFFGSHGVPPEAVLRDAVEIAARVSRGPSDGPHVVTGPVRVTGAQPGDLLAVTVVEALPRVPYGVVSNRHGRGALPGELPRTPGTVSVFTPVRSRPDGAVGCLPLVDGGPRVVEFPLAPFPGIVGVATDGDRRVHSVPPGAHGGNIDVNLLTAGSTVLLPVQVAGALAYVGDPHFAQGNGEVALTALEASLRLTLRFDVVPADVARSRFGDLTGPVVQTPELLVPMGLDPDLGEAMRACVRQSLGLLVARYGMAEHLAYAYLSAATDFEVSQVVDQVVGVHARIRLADFERVPS